MLKSFRLYLRHITYFICWPLSHECLHNSCNVYWLRFSTRGQCITISGPYLSLTLSNWVLSKYLQRFFLPKSDMFTWHPSRKPRARLSRRLDRRTPVDNLSICWLWPTVEHVRLSPAEQLVYEGVGGHDNLGAAHTT